MASRKQWSDLSERTRTLLITAAVAEGILKVRRQQRTYLLLLNSPQPDPVTPGRTRKPAAYPHRPDQGDALIPVCAARPIPQDSSLPVRSQIHTGSLVKRRILVALALVGLLSVVLVSRAGAATRTTSDVVWMSNHPKAGTTAGTSTLTRTDSGIALVLHTSGLQAGHAVTIWWMIFNHPQACISGASTPTPDDPRCGMADINNSAAGLSVLYAAGNIVDEDGEADFGAYRQEGDTDGALPGMGLGLLDAAAADVHLVVRDHGPVDPRHVVEQIHTFDDFCNPTCTDLQMSVHEAR
jgi:hypothetical protein